MAAIECPNSHEVGLSGSMRLRRASLTPNRAEVVVHPCFHTVCKNFAPTEFLARDFAMTSKTFQYWCLCRRLSSACSTMQTLTPRFYALALEAR
jgi:hypothetical protein